MFLGQGGLGPAMAAAAAAAAALVPARWQWRG